jgi:hypothetical protein
MSLISAGSISLDSTFKYTSGANKLFLKLRAHKFFLHYQLPREQIVLRVNQEYTLPIPFLLQQGPTNPSSYSKCTQTLPSTARAHKPFLLQQGHTNPSFFSKGTYTLPSTASYTNPSFHSKIHKPFLLQQGHTNPSFYSKGTQTLPCSKSTLPSKGTKTLPSKSTKSLPLE